MPRRNASSSMRRSEEKCPVAIWLDVVEIVVARDLDETRLDETGARHLLEQLRHRRIALQLDTDRFREVTGERPPTRDVVVRIGDGHDVARRPEHPGRLAEVGVAISRCGG